MHSAANIFNEAEKAAIISAIKEAELNTSGEIRLHVENHCKENPLERSAEIFHALEMDSTEQKNGVLIYLAVKDKKFAIIGDKGIDEVVPENFWDSIRNKMHDQFKDGNFVEGIKLAIQSTGEKLKAYFPYNTDDINELPDDISFEDGV